jgi:putative spermidine/putrescine transport system permease protein
LLIRRSGREKRSIRLSQGMRILLLLSPALAVILLLFAGGLAFGFIQSLNYLPLIGQDTVNLDAYRQTFQNPEFVGSLWLTLRISLTATLLSAALAIASGLLIRATRIGRRLLTFIFQLNLPIPHLVGAVAMLLMLSQSGLLSRLVHAGGLTETPADFPALVADRWAIAITAEYVWKEVPFIGVVVLAALASGIEDYENAARVLGASRWQRFRYITLPLVTPAVLSTSIIVFAFTFGAFEVPFLLGRPFPTVLPVLAYRAYTDVDLAARSQAMAMSMVIAGIVTVLILFYMRLSHRFLRASR